MIGALLLALAAQVVTPALGADRKFEGAWYIADTTDNNTGEREVYAFQNYIKPNDPDFVQFYMRCTKGAPTFIVEWLGADAREISFPAQTVLTISPVNDDGTNPDSHQFIFGRSDEETERGIRATRDTSAKIISVLARSKRAMVTANLVSASRTIEVDVNGTQAAWSRVVRHCPVRMLPRPPL